MAKPVTKPVTKSVTKQNHTLQFWTKLPKLLSATVLAEIIGQLDQ